MAVREIQLNGKGNAESNLTDISSSEPLPPSNWKSEWQQLIEEKRAAASVKESDKDLKALLKDLFG